MKLNAILKAAEKYNNSNIELNKIEPQPQEEQSRAEKEGSINL